jgi:hypothetical protein
VALVNTVDRSIKIESISEWKLNLCRRILDDGAGPVVK